MGRAPSRTGAPRLVSSGLVLSGVRCQHGAMRLAAILASAWVLASCASQQVVDHFSEVRSGMTKDEVLALLGQPSSRWILNQKSDGVIGERLQWGDGLSSLASSAVYRGKPDRAYCVDFDESGKVVSKAAPAWVEQGSE